MSNETGSWMRERPSLAALSCPLPADIRRLKEAGRLQEAETLIRRRLSDQETSLPAMLRERLQLELAILPRIPMQYPYSRREALKLLCARIRDFREEELTELLSAHAFEWIFLEGEQRFHELFLANLLKTRPAFAARDLTPDDTAGKKKDWLKEEISKTRQEGAGTARIRLRTTMKLTPEGLRRYRGKAARIYLPLPVECAEVRNLTLLEISPRPVTIAGPQYPQRTAVFETESLGDESYAAAVSFDWFLPYQEPDPGAVLLEQPRFYTEEFPPHIRFTPCLRRLSAEIVGTEQNPLLKAWRIYDYITTHVRYSYVGSYAIFENIPEYAAINQKGDCGFQALLFITLCRINGIPARWQSGLWATPFETGSHDWAQYYVAPFGWLFADCSFGGAAYRDGDEERRVFYRANVEPHRVPQATEFQHGFCVPEGALRYDPYDNQAGEMICEGQALMAYGRDFETGYELF